MWSLTQDEIESVRCPTCNAPSACSCESDKPHPARKYLAALVATLRAVQEEVSLVAATPVSRLARIDSFVKDELDDLRRRGVLGPAGCPNCRAPVRRVEGQPDMMICTRGCMTCSACGEIEIHDLDAVLCPNNCHLRPRSDRRGLALKLAERWKWGNVSPGRVIRALVRALEGNGTNDE